MDYHCVECGEDMEQVETISKTPLPDKMDYICDFCEEYLEENGFKILKDFSIQRYSCKNIVKGRGRYEFDLYHGDIKIDRYSKKADSLMELKTTIKEIIKELIKNE